VAGQSGGDEERGSHRHSTESRKKLNGKMSEPLQSKAGFSRQREHGGTAGRQRSFQHR